MPKSAKKPSFEQRCYESLPLVAFVNNHWIPRQHQSESDQQQEADAGDLYSQPTQAALKVAVITNILLIGIPRLLLSVTEYFERGTREASRGILDRSFCACMLVACKVSSGALSIVPSIILHLFNKIKENRQESTPLLSDQRTDSPDQDLDNSATVPTVGR